VGACWDLVDPIAAHLVGHLWRTHRLEVSTKMDPRITDDHLWIRRTAILGQLQHRADTDEARLFTYCLGRASETDVFLRKAIGWALR
jgi:3-methyladenine DNA glycosylase AlkD